MKPLIRPFLLILCIAFGSCAGAAVGLGVGLITTDALGIDWGQHRQTDDAPLDDGTPLYISFGYHVILEHLPQVFIIGLSVLLGLLSAWFSGRWLWHFVAAEENGT